jgi:hypothetical protein
MSDLPVLVFVEKEQEVPFVQAFLHPYAIEVHGGFTQSGAISSGEASLLDFPERPVVVLINTGTEDEREAAVTRLATKRLLARAYPENWCVAVAVPRLEAWAKTDPRIKRELEASFGSNSIYIDRARRMSELVKDQPFDSTELYRRNADFRGLIEFLQKHAPAPATITPRAASS